MDDRGVIVLVGAYVSRRYTEDGEGAGRRFVGERVDLAVMERV
jgi:hypothetical protein